MINIMERAGCNAPAARSSLQPKQKAVIPPRTILRPNHNVSRYVELDLPDTQRSCVQPARSLPLTPQPHAPSLQLFGGGSHPRASPRRTRDVVQDQGQQQERTSVKFTTIIDAREGRYEEIQNFTKPDTHVQRCKRDPPKRPEPPKRSLKPARPPPPKPRQKVTSTSRSASTEYDYIDLNNPRRLLWNRTVRAASLPADISESIHGRSEDVYMPLEQSMMSEDSAYAIPTGHVPPEHSSEDPDEDHDYTVPEDSVYYNFQDTSFGRGPGIYAPLIDQTIQDAPVYQEIIPVHSAPVYQEIVPVHSATSSLPAAPVYQEITPVHSATSSLPVQ